MEEGGQIGEVLVIQGRADGSQTRVAAVQKGELEVYTGNRTYGYGH